MLFKLCTSISQYIITQLHEAVASLSLPGKEMWPLSQVPYSGLVPVRALQFWKIFFNLSLTSVISCPQKAIFSLYLKLASKCHRYSFKSITRLAVHASGLPNILISMTWHTPAYICIRLLATWWWPACHHVLPGYKSLTLPINSYRNCVPPRKHICFPVYSSCTSPVPS